MKESSKVVIGLAGSFAFFLVAVWFQHVYSVETRWQNLKLAEEQLQSSQQKLTAALGDDSKSTLQDEYRAWLEQRDEECHLRPRERTGDYWMEAIAWHSDKVECLIRVTNRRTGDLRARLKTAMTPRSGAAAG